MKIQDIKKGDLLFLKWKKDYCLIISEPKRESYEKICGYKTDEMYYASSIFFLKTKDFTENGFLGKETENINEHWKLLCR